MTHSIISSVEAKFNKWPTKVEIKVLIITINHFRLWKAQGENGTPVPASNDTGEEMRLSMVELKSPLQLLSQVEQMHKEELDQVLYKLQHENR